MDGVGDGTADVFPAGWHEDPNGPLSAPLRDFSGRAPRSEYWWFPLTILLGSVVTSALGEALSTLFTLAIIVPSLAVGARRLHDTGRSGWWQLLALLPLIGPMMLIVWFATVGDRRPNAYGPPSPS